ncbi:hypothetical protein P5673_025409 [Acropora cervicornis]|uniref:Uncharacterized protein n=1 Tax=Acropora cervicornis TaxID=6130 RepID=A0AAD9Q1W8_ACRCE|nr:hypothetical protein P5673_025409 [Acropora cervicornis]
MVQTLHLHLAWVEPHRIQLRVFGKTYNFWDFFKKAEGSNAYEIHVHGQCAAAIENKLYIFVGVRWLSDIGEVLKSNEIVIFDVANLSLKKLDWVTSHQLAHQQEWELNLYMEKNYFLD